MNTVGPDKRTQYYRLSPEAVLKTLKSHPLGLTNSAAARRQTEQGANILPASRLSDGSLVMQAAGHPFVATAAFSALLASTSGQTGLALALTALVTLHIMLRFGLLRSRLLMKIEIVLPAHAKVTRNDQTRGLETSKLVVGDIVQVEAGETVPADLRILEEHDLVTNDSVLFGGNVHTRKFTPAMRQAVPLIARNNQLWAGSTVMQGTARGVAIAIGAQTELGRIMMLHRVAQLNRLRQESRNPNRYTFAALIVITTLALLLLGWQSGSDNTGIVSALLLLAVGVVPNGLVLSRWLSSSLATRTLAKKNTAFSSNALAAIGGVDLAIIDTTEASKNMVIASSVTVGRTTYTAEDTGYEPTGLITDSRGKALTHRQLAELKLLFEACTYTNSAAVLRPSNHQKNWHARGSLYEVAALVLARKAGLNTEQLQVKHEALRSFPYDAGRQLASSVRRYGGDNVVFVRGNPAAVLERSKKIWDHGHVRALSAGDKTFFTRETPATKGKAYMAFAYRILPNKVDPNTLDADTSEQDLTLLGVVTMEHVSELESVIAAAKVAGLTTVTLTAETHPGTTSSTDLRKLTDTELIALLKHDGSFSRLAAEDVLRLVTVSQHAEHRAVVIGNSLTTLPARIQADAAVTFANSQQHEPDDNRDAAELITAVDAGRSLLNKLVNMRHLAVIQITALAATALLSAIGLFYYHVPLAISLGAVLAIQVLIFPLAIYALPPTKAHHIVTREFTAAGSVLGLLTYGSFLYSFGLRGISPDFISQTSRFTLGATTVSAMVLSLALAAETLLVHYQAKAALSAQAMISLGITLFVIINLAYNPWLQAIFSTGGLTLADWLTISSAVLLYTGFRLFQHHTRHHTREAVLQLHREVHGQRV